MRRKWLWAALLVVGSVRPSAACMNDRDSDTLAQQGRALPDVVRVITGRFERNPPLYYQMRIARVGKELQSHPERLALYDDIAVAYDRLGRDDEAIAWMNRKKARLTKSSTRSPANKEALYRYYANNGTFLAHRWLRAGANRARLNEMKTARGFIAEAIKIKPDAHFGREKYQLMTMDWIIEAPSVVHQVVGPPDPEEPRGPLIAIPKTFAMPLGEYIDKKIQGDPSKPRVSNQETTGLSGLIVLGNAWESVDIFNALGYVIDTSEQWPTLHYLAILRCSELVAQGKHSLHPGIGAGNVLEERKDIDKGLSDGRGVHVNPQNQAAIETVYRRLRTEAEAWQTRRTSYMTARLQSGRHPDTDKTFWRDWKDTPAPPLDVPWYSERAAMHNEENKMILFVYIFFISLFLVPLTLRILWKIWLARRRRLLSVSTQ